MKEIIGGSVDEWFDLWADDIHKRKGKGSIHLNLSIIGGNVTITIFYAHNLLY